ncbi:MAG TPA: histidine kinase N-terminal domain-containing protein [Egibacteraceae bacterium]|nr:histidine kinase N-terminal domain-containing protein [Egibacteraceae bacterium]
MSVLKDLLAGAAQIDDATVDHLQLLLGEWQTLADLSFADLLLWVRGEMDGRPAYLCVGQMRPYTAQTIYHEDLVGLAIRVTDRPMVGRAFDEERVIRDADPDWSTGVPVREEAIPVRFRDQVIAVVTREANVSTARAPSELELTYLQSAGELAQMLAEGTFPYEGDDPDARELSPRVGDGIMRVDGHGLVSYASPNAVSAYRRLGSMDNLVGAHLSECDEGHEELSEGLADGRPVETEIERLGAIVLRRLLPLISEGKVVGGLLLIREVTELRRHERALRLKDATIREIHHRVKNNLQTVASLLRLQARRVKSREGRDALNESVRRISSIALVHETLSKESRQRVRFEKIARQIVDLLADGLIDPDSPIVFEMEGTAGDLPAEIATPLALVVTELLQNCVEHAFPDRVEDAARPAEVVRIGFERRSGILRVVVEDNGVGLPEGRSLDSVANLGLQIARTLVESELHGTMMAVPSEGTAIELMVPLG